MKIITQTGGYKVSTQKLYSFLSKEENLPKWATKFCKSITKDKTNPNYYKIITQQNDELLFRIDTNEKLGTIDMYLGEKMDMLWKIPTRVVSDNMNGSIFIFTLIQMPNQSDEEFELSNQGVQEELEVIKSIFQ